MAVDTVSSESSDPRVRRTRRLLQEAVLALAEECDFDAITVRDISLRAEVNRATFYLHYRDKNDLIAAALDELFEELTAEDRSFAASHPTLVAETVPSGIVAQFQHVTEHARLFRRLLGGTGSRAFADRLRAYHEGQFLRVWHDMGLRVTPGSAPVEVRARYAAAAGQGVITWWLDGGLCESSETMAGWLWQISGPLWFENILAATDLDKVTVPGITGQSDPGD